LYPPEIKKTNVWKKEKGQEKREKPKLLSILLPFAMLSVPIQQNCP
jgi:hypothetical protein